MCNRRIPTTEFKCTLHKFLAEETNLNPKVLEAKSDKQKRARDKAHSSNTVRTHTIWENVIFLPEQISGLKTELWSNDNMEEGFETTISKSFNMLIDVGEALKIAQQTGARFQDSLLLGRYGAPPNGFETWAKFAGSSEAIFNNWNLTLLSRDDIEEFCAKGRDYSLVQGFIKLNSDTRRPPSSEPNTPVGRLARDRTSLVRHSATIRADHAPSRQDDLTTPPFVHFSPLPPNILPEGINYNTDDCPQGGVINQKYPLLFFYPGRENTSPNTQLILGMTSQLVKKDLNSTKDSSQRAVMFENLGFFSPLSSGRMVSRKIDDIKISPVTRITPEGETRFFTAKDMVADMISRLNYRERGLERLGLRLRTLQVDLNEGRISQSQFNIAKENLERDNFSHIPILIVDWVNQWAAQGVDVTIFTPGHGDISQLLRQGRFFNESMPPEAHVGTIKNGDTWKKPWEMLDQG